MEQYPGELIKMEIDRTEEEGSQYLLELAIFIASSTRDAIHWKHYGTLRLLDSLIKVLDLPNHIQCIEKDRFLEEVKIELEKNKSLRTEEEAFADFLDEVIQKMLKEYRNRLTLTKKPKKTDRYR